ncbi:hypothetical protein [Neomegalonema sp.]|uniref:hypothetical protein n=1 Tax=Neomegalonema sp. TaxID=2039713 RepID=UPI00260462BE|nr:hypothetical protein [Neomegalonema sp.]MDD2869686.1 hypothetical protein [Neomegalonema sp.]
MGKTLEMKPRTLDLLRKANEGAEIIEDFEVKVGLQTFKFRLAAPDIFTILKDQERCYQREYAVCVKDGLQEMPINESDWRKDLDRITDEDVREAQEKNKPVDLAQQVAEKNARFDTIMTLLPKILRDQDNKSIAETPTDQAELSRMIALNPSLMAALTEKYTNILSKINEVNRESKNLEGKNTEPK